MCHIFHDGIRIWVKCHGDNKSKEAKFLVAMATNLSLELVKMTKNDEFHVLKLSK